MTSLTADQLSIFKSRLETHSNPLYRRLCALLIADPHAPAMPQFVARAMGTLRPATSLNDLACAVEKNIHYRPVGGSGIAATRLLVHFNLSQPADSLRQEVRECLLADPLSDPDTPSFRDGRWCRDVQISFLNSAANIAVGANSPFGVSRLTMVRLLRSVTLQTVGSRDPIRRTTPETWNVFADAALHASTLCGIDPCVAAEQIPVGYCDLITPAALRSLGFVKDATVGGQRRRYVISDPEVTGSVTLVFGRTISDVRALISARTYSPLLVRATLTMRRRITSGLPEPRHFDVNLTAPYLCKGTVSDLFRRNADHEAEAATQDCC